MQKVNHYVEVLFRCGENKVGDAKTDKDGRSWYWYTHHNDEKVMYATYHENNHQQWR